MAPKTERVPKKKEKKEKTIDNVEVLPKDETKEPSEVKEVPEKEKKVRKPTSYNNFVKQKMSEVKDKPHTERFKLLSVMWKSLSKEEQDSYKSA